MAGRKPDDDQKAIPTSRVGRFARVAKMAGGVAGGMIAEGTRQLKAGKRPRARDMLLTPGNARRVADQLATMRGAAMKVGQILSMDTGDFLPRELADILARLRSDARYMPPNQLNAVMTEAYGEEWEAMFYGFEHKPLAAASIGQVHRTVSPDGREIVLKVQYPGIANSIDADVDNIASLLNISGLLPAELEIQPLLEDAKAQLHDEADYHKEAEFLAAFGELLADDERFVVPEVIPDITRKTVLAMTYVEGEPIETIATLPQADRDAVMAALVELMFRELFELRMVQTDPNFANYQYNRRSGKIVLLDFGATRRFKAGFVNNYRSLAKAAIAGNEKRLLAAAEKVGYAVGDEDSEYREMILALFLVALEPLQHEGPYDFAASDMAARMSQLGEDVTRFKDFWKAPPTDAVYFHRKLGGMFMLASRLKARVDVQQLLRQFL
ncbi:ubiquinol-cytochrome C reductase [Halioglobus sp. HI00S01]|uniref:ABC1 kinase family protein n=1 Tax=Halioglobus sp. HI00S01 TaxID=1822214 RepID=UPI0007C3A8F1|nr:AarF/ABC1/UbiB kinase family protein [Halioglobus sp. HI00S01]KZX54953.1 ubiquinol-cytochrome C reductase [Halioglobus sp. HI00S01]